VLHRGQRQVSVTNADTLGVLASCSAINRAPPRLVRMYPYVGMYEPAHILQAIATYD
jgi:hypothetical protein